MIHVIERKIKEKSSASDFLKVLSLSKDKINVISDIVMLLHGSVEVSGECTYIHTNYVTALICTSSTQTVVIAKVLEVPFYQELIFFLA